MGDPYDYYPNAPYNQPVEYVDKDDEAAQRADEEYQSKVDHELEYEGLEDKE